MRRTLVPGRTLSVGSPEFFFFFPERQTAITGGDASIRNGMNAIQSNAQRPLEFNAQTNMTCWSISFSVCPSLSLFHFRNVIFRTSISTYNFISFDAKEESVP